VCKKNTNIEKRFARLSVTLCRLCLHVRACATANDKTCTFEMGCACNREDKKKAKHKHTQANRLAGCAQVWCMKKVD